MSVLQDNANSLYTCGTESSDGSPDEGTTRQEKTVTKLPFSRMSRHVHSPGSLVCRCSRFLRSGNARSRRRLSLLCCRMPCGLAGSSRRDRAYLADTDCRMRLYSRPSCAASQADKGFFRKAGRGCRGLSPCGSYRQSHCSSPERD